MKLLASALVLLAGVGWLSNPPDIAPDPVPRKGEALGPRAPTKVAMVDEVVTIALRENDADVRATFTMRNTGTAPETLEVGFPTAAQPSSYRVSDRGLEVLAWGKPAIDNFTATVEGVPVRPEPKQASTDIDAGLGSWLCWRMTYEPGQTRRVEVSYSVKTRDPNYTEPSPLRYRQLTYILKSGAGWHGPIGSARIILELGRFSGRHFELVAPAPTRKDESKWIWQRDNFEPDADILLNYRLFADEAEAIDRLGPLVAKPSPPIEDLLDFAEALETTRDKAAAANAFVALGDAEDGDKSWAARFRVPWRCPYLVAAKLYASAGDERRAAEAAQKAIKRLESVIARGGWHLTKIVLRDRDELRGLIEEARGILGASSRPESRPG